MSALVHPLGSQDSRHPRRNWTANQSHTKIAAKERLHGCVHGKGWRRGLVCLSPNPDICGYYCLNECSCFHWFPRLGTCLLGDHTQILCSWKFIICLWKENYIIPKASQQRKKPDSCGRGRYELQFCFNISHQHHAVCLSPCCQPPSIITIFAHRVVTK